MVRDEYGEVHQTTLQCSHCGGHWLYQKGSGIRRGWCPVCEQATCGHADCDTHAPHQARLDLTDALNRNDAGDVKYIKRLVEKYPGIKPI